MLLEDHCRRPKFFHRQNIFIERLERRIHRNQNETKRRMANKGPFKGKGKDKGTMNADDAKRAEEEYWVGIEVKREMYAFLVEAGFKGNEQWDFFLQIFF